MTGTPSPFTTLLPGSPAAPDQQQGPAPAGPSGRPRLRTQVLALAAAGALVAAGVAGYLLLGNGSGDGASSGPVVTHASRMTTTPSASATGSATVTTPAVVGTGRDPFAQPSGQASAPAAGSASAGTGADSSTASAAGTSAATVTVTAAPSVYLGLYAFTGTKATFWVNDQSYQVDPGGTFAGFTYTSKTSATCAKVTKSGTATTICTGNVTKIG
jgi:hypothetical protein